MNDSEKVLTRNEVREKLAERTASISSRVETLESELPIKAKTLKQLYDNKHLIKRGVAVGAGVVVLALLLRRKKSSVNDYSEGLERVSKIITREIRKNMKAGMDTEDAVLSAMKKRPPVVQVGGNKDNSDSLNTLSLVLRQVAISLGPALLDILADILRQSPKRDGEK